jgi:16S rRNA processing protein RimM
MEEFFQVGVITATHGIHGEVKVFPTTDDPNRFKKLKKVLLDTGIQKLELEVAGVKFFKKFVILKFKEFDDINQVEKYRKCPLLVTRENAVRLKKNEYFIADLIGLKVYTEDGTFLGNLEDVMQTGANDVYQIVTEEGKEILLPAIRQCILDVDIESGNMKVHLLEGLVDA